MTGGVASMRPKAQSDLTALIAIPGLFQSKFSFMLAQKWYVTWTDMGCGLGRPIGASIRPTEGRRAGWASRALFQPQYDLNRICLSA